MSFSRSSLIGKVLTPDCPGQQCKCSPNTFNPSMLPHHVADTRSIFVASKTSFLHQEEEHLSASHLEDEHLELSLLERTIWSRLTWRGAFGGVKFGGEHWEASIWGESGTREGIVPPPDDITCTRLTHTSPTSTNRLFVNFDEQKTALTSYVFRNFRKFVSRKYHQY